MPTATTSVAITEPDGSLSIMLFVLPPAPAEGEPPIDVDGAIAAEVAAQRRSAVSWRRVRADELPASRSYRAAWVDRAGRIEVDMPRAREVLRDRIRVLRERRLAELDKEYLRADEQNDGARKRQIAVQKQALRDAPADPRIDAAATPQALDDLLAILIG